MEVSGLASDILESWDRNNRVNLFLLEALEESWLEAAPRPRARSIAKVFAHIHNVRLVWVEIAARQHYQPEDKLGKDAGLDKNVLKQALIQSGKAAGEMLKEGLDAGKIKGSKLSIPGFLAYLLAHEAHHRGQIMLALHQAGHRLPNEIKYGLWEWEKR